MKKIVFPVEWICDEWYGFTRHTFEVDGCKAWVVEPHYAAGDGRWSWCTVWPESFVERVGITALLEHGFYHAHVDAYKTSASPEGIAIMRHFHDILVGLGLSEKANLIGMSWGGFFSLRYAEENPQHVAAIYLDAPVCNAADRNPCAADRLEMICKNYRLTPEQLDKSPLNPINNLKPLVDNKIPMMASTGEDDLVVLVKDNINIVEARLKELGYEFPIMRRPAWGHHPHGRDDVKSLLDFHFAAREIL